MITMKTMMSKAFRAHGHLCASRPWEVIIGTITLTVCVMSMSMFATNKVCDWNYKCLIEDDTKSSDVIILTITKCIAIMYIYLQFRNLRKLGSQYLLGIAGVFTIFSSFVFSIAVVNMVGSDLTGLNEALPFFLLLVDLAKACTLARFALSARTQEEVVENIGHGMAILGPTVTLDTLVEVLVIGVGTISGIRQLETMCCFGCLSVVANYLAFMTFYPACLALVLELTRGRREGGGTLSQLQQLASIALKEEEEQKPNPVTQRVKIIMSAGLVLVHAHSRLLASDDGDLTLGEVTGAAGSSGNVNDMSHYINPTTPLWKFYTYKALTPTVDYVVTVSLGVILALKYIFFDGEIDVEHELQKKENEAKKKEEGGEGASNLCDECDFRDLNWFRSRSSTMPTPIKPRLANLIQMVEIEEHINTENVRSGNIGRYMPPEELDLDFEPRPRLDSNTTFTVGDSDTDSETDTVLMSSRGGLRRRRPVATAEMQTQTEDYPKDEKIYEGPPRSLEQCVAIMKSDEGPGVLSDEEIMSLVSSKQLPAYKLEGILGDHERGVAIRRKMISKSLADQTSLRSLPYANYDYSYVEGACCENVLGYMPVPVGVAGPLLLDGVKYQVPMATTEGCLVASTNRGCRALASAGGVTSALIGNGMTRAPVVRFKSAYRASEAKRWLEDPENFDLMAEHFASTSRFARLKRLQVVQAARNLYIRFVAITGDAMGMNMISKGAEKALNFMTEVFPDMELMSLSGNFCTDKKPSAINWLEGRGKSVVCEAVVPAQIVKTVLKTTVPALVDLNISKNLMGSAMAGSIGGYNAHAANIVTAIYIATGQDPAQCVCSSYCMTVIEPSGPSGEDLYISCTMPSIEIGTIGGGTVLPPQSACLQMLGVKGACKEQPGNHASKLASIVCGTVLAGELSLMSALAAGHLVRSHLKHNRSSLNMAPTPVTSQSAPVVGSCIKN